MSAPIQMQEHSEYDPTYVPTRVDSNQMSKQLSNQMRNQGSAQGFSNSTHNFEKWNNQSLQSTQEKKRWEITLKEGSSTKSKGKN